MAISEQIIQVINALCEKFGIVINWAEEDVIPHVEILCKKLVTYEIVTSVVWLLLIWVLFGTSAITLRKLHPWLMKKSDEDYDDVYMIVDFSLWILTIILGVAVVFVTCDQAIDIIKCLTFPEMYVFEYISALVK